MKELDSKILERELRDNHDTHEIFKHQSRILLSDLEDNLKESNEIVLNINLNSIMPFYRLTTKMKHEEYEDENFWQHAVSVLFMQDLKDRYNVETIHNLAEEKKVLTRVDIEDYSKVENVLINRNDVIEAIKSLNPSRVHIILEYMKNDDVIEEVLHYIDEDIPFVTMIYYDGEIPEEIINGKYHAKVFDYTEEGVLTHKEVNKTYEKKI